MYTLRQLQMFEAVSRKQSYSRAAEELGVSQPSVSVQVHELEKDLGVELFARSGRHTTLTEVGTIFYGRTVKILEDVEQSLVEVDGYLGLERGRLRLGATEALGMYVLPEFIARYSGEHPGIDVELTLESNEDILDGLQSGRLDVGFGDLEIPEAGPILAREIASTEFVLVTGRGHTLSLQQKINSDELTGEAFIIEGEGSPSFVGLEWLATGMRGATPTVTMQVGSCEALKQMVRAHLGITVTYRVCIEWEYAASQLHILEITDLGAQRALYQYQLTSRTPTAAAAAFLELTAGEFPQA
jgi:DNA-binding transcriptional LysR family regulator